MYIVCNNKILKICLFDSAANIVLCYHEDNGVSEQFKAEFRYSANQLKLNKKPIENQHFSFRYV